MRLLIVGPQGAGKGTQAALLAESLGIPHVSTGDLFRANLAGGTELGMLVKKYVDSGELVPDEVTQDMVADRVSQPDAEPGFLLDGFPRNITQADWLTAMLDGRHAPIERVVLLTAPDQVLLDRMLSRGRADDTVEAITRRLDIYHRETTPLIDYYDGRVVHVDGVGEVDEVHRRVLEAVRSPLTAAGELRG
ncbi:adenylate kinase [Nakamurella sp. PAMC28650]|uniref:adenylate kinase n=1 Tax=Nakamurella sp. PAMC28650 TaxID=2762325 RepID=UPI00164DE711|nr:adenylate kinase [Nakamurella sp. PAMC28650]QNK83005.1 adenylate kinase [Nakamurella sp. PAMC28650]